MTRAILAPEDQALIERTLLPGEITVAQSTALWSKLPILLDAARREVRALIKTEG